MVSSDIDWIGLGITDLVSVIPPDAELSPTSKIVPEARGKVPGLTGSTGWHGYDWRNAPAWTATDLHVARRTGANVGVRGDRWPAIDVDVDDKDLAEIVVKAVHGWFGAFAPRRHSKGQRALFMLRTHGPIPRQQLHIYKDGEKRGAVEFLGAGQQYVVEGTHPSGAEYRWDPAWRSEQEGAAPYVDPQLLKDWFDDLTECLQAAGHTTKASSGQLPGTAAPVDQDLLLAPSDDEAEAFLRGYPNDDGTCPDWDEWVKHIHAIKASFRDKDRGLAAGMEWNLKAEHVSPEDRDNFESQYARSENHRIGWQWLIDRAGNYGAQHEFAVEPNAPTAEPKRGRRVNLVPFLDGTYKPPVPSVGAPRGDGVHLLYPGRWHTLMAPTGTGKTWFLLGHAKAVLDNGGIVAYLHFEEVMPSGTLERLRSMGVSREAILERFMWMSCERRWAPDEMRAELQSLKPDLVLLDGINAAGTQHGQDPEKVGSVGWYRATFVTPAVATGATVVSAGHPVKARDRQDERHGFGSTAWLDEVDGVAFRLSSTNEPMRKGSRGSAVLSSVKDRYGSVEQHAAPHTKYEGWKYLGQFVVDSDAEFGLVQLSITVPEHAGMGATKLDPLDVLGEQTVEVIRGLGGNFDSNRSLRNHLRAAGVRFSDSDVEPALLRLEANKVIAREPDPGSRKPRRGWLNGTPKTEGLL